MTKIIITDLTRFSKRDKVCTAGIDTGVCIRPMPYLKIRYCKKKNILPGAVLSVQFTDFKNVESPHNKRGR